MRRMWIRSSLVALLGSLLVAAPWPARAADYGAQYWPSIAPTPAPKGLGEPAQTNLQGLTPGATLSFKVTVKNTGTLTWVSEGPNPFLLGYGWTVRRRFPSRRRPTCRRPRSRPGRRCCSTPPSRCR